MIDLLNDIIINFFHKIVSFIPNFFGGLLILLIGLVLSSLLKKILLSLFSFFKLSSLLQKAHLMQHTEVKMWQEVFAETFRWTIIILFLIPALETWGLSRAITVLNQLLFYLPNVIIALVIGFLGIVTSNLASEWIQNSTKTLGQTGSSTLSISARIAIVFFTILIVMNQLGVAQDLVRILFTGIVAMIAIAGGLAFGLGGRESAEEVLKAVKKRFQREASSGLT